MSTWRRSKSNAQTVRELHRRREMLRRAEDARIAQLAGTGAVAR